MTKLSIGEEWASQKSYKSKTIARREGYAWLAGLIFVLALVIVISSYYFKKQLYFSESSVNPRSANFIIWAFRVFVLLPPKTTTIMRSPLFSAIIAPLKPDALV